MTVRQRRQAGYRWRLREVMAAHQMYATTALVPLLAERGIVLSASQVHRLVTGTPERLSLAVLSALCDIFDITPEQLIEVEASSVTRRTAATAGTTTEPAATGPLRPRRARIVDQ